MGGIGLYEYLAQPVAADTALPGSSYSTRQDNETVDEDAGVDALGIPAATSENTRLTFTSNETADEELDVLTLSVLHWSDGSTVLTKTEGETFDDDPGVGPLAVPATLT